MLYDVHTHLFDKAFKEDKERIIRRCFEEKISFFETGLDYKTNNSSLNLSKKYDNIYCCMGMHPSCPFDERIIKQLKDNKSLISAVGEVGLDFKYENKKEQLIVFNKMIKLANELGKPLIVHSRAAHAEVLNELKQASIPIILHSFSASRKNLNSAFNNPLIHFSIPSSIEYYDYYQELVKEVNIGRLFCETDSPYLWKFERNTPLNVVKSYENIARIKRLSFKETERLIELNVKRVLLKDFK